MAASHINPSPLSTRHHSFHTVVRDAAAWVEIRDHWVMLRLSRWRPPRWMRIWMIAATRGGDGWLWYAMGLVVALFGGPERFLAMGAATASAGVGIALFLKLKRLCARKRPCAIEPHC